MSSPQLSPSPSGSPTSVGSQVSLLQQRGMSIPDLNEAERFLNNVSYYRFRRYLKPFVDHATNSATRPFGGRKRTWTARARRCTWAKRQSRRWPRSGPPTWTGPRPFSACRPASCRGGLRQWPLPPVWARASAATAAGWEWPRTWRPAARSCPR